MQELFGDAPVVRITSTEHASAAAQTLPPQILGDIVVVETGESTSTGKIVNSLSEIHIGDLVIKKCISQRGIQVRSGS